MENYVNVLVPYQINPQQGPILLVNCKGTSAFSVDLVRRQGIVPDVLCTVYSLPTSSSHLILQWVFLPSRRQLGDKWAFQLWHPIDGISFKELPACVYIIVWRKAKLFWFSQASLIGLYFVFYFIFVLALRIFYFFILFDQFWMYPDNCMYFGFFNQAFLPEKGRFVILFGQ